MRQRTVEANGLKFGILELGEGPLALCLHGFPDSAHSFRHQLPALAEAGFHAVAPFMRGYAPTEVPADGRYSIGTLIADTVGLHEALDGDEDAVLIGHDWGAAAAFGASSFAPERWRRVVTSAVAPFSLNARIFGDYDQLKRFFYFFFFGSPLAEPVLAADGMGFIERLWRDWSPGYDPSEDLPHVKEAIGHPENLAAAIGYYRAVLAFLDGEPDPHPEEAEGLGVPSPQPHLHLHGADDGCVAFEVVHDIAEYLPPGSELHVVEGAGHFCHLEKPGEVNERVVAWVTGG